MRIQALITKAEQTEGLRQRISEIDRDAKEFGREVASLIARIAPDLASATSFQAVAVLDARLKEATANQAQRGDAEKSCDKRRTDIDRGRATIAECEKRLAGLCVGGPCERGQGAHGRAAVRGGRKAAGEDAGLSG